MVFLATTCHCHFEDKNEPWISKAFGHVRWGWQWGAKRVSALPHSPPFLVVKIDIDSRHSPQSCDRLITGWQMCLRAIWSIRHMFRDFFLKPTLALTIFMAEAAAVSRWCLRQYVRSPPWRFLWHPREDRHVFIPVLCPACKHKL